MAKFPSQTGKHVRNQKIVFAATTSFCLGVIGIGSVQAANTDNSNGASSKASAADSNNASSSDSSGSTNTKADVTINGKEMRLNEDGELHKTWQDGNSRGEVDVNIDKDTRASTDSSVNIELHTRSSSSTDG